jgi:pSer/pThr/pTyr-binding forkhead associated (FHA) protein
VVARRLLADALALAGGEAAPPQLVLATGRRAGQTWRLPAPPSRLLAGRGEGCEIVLDDPDCSRQHAEFVRDGDGVLVRDLGSKNGVLVAGRRVLERRLRDGDEIRLGRTVLAFSDPAEQLLRAFETGNDEPAPVDLAPSPPLVPPTESAPPETAGEPPSEPSPAVERNAPTMPPPAPGEPAAPPPAPAASRSVARRGPARTADWVVAALAMVILSVSVAALYFLLRGTPVPAR